MDIGEHMCHVRAQMGEIVESAGFGCAVAYWVTL